MVITALRARRNRPYLHTVLFVLLVSWLSLVISATCTMPMASTLMAMSEHMPGCPQSFAPEHPHHQDPAAKTMPDCSFKPCLDSQNSSHTQLNSPAKLELPVFILSLIGAFFCLLLSYPPTKVPLRKTDPPLGRRVLLIYRFCTLLN